MKIKCKSGKVILPLSILLSFPSLSAEICSISEEFEGKLNDFSPNVEISELETIKELNIGELTHSIPNFEAETSELKISALDFFNLEISALQLKDGIERGNTQEIVNSSVMLASTFVPTMVDLTIEALALEFDSNPITMAIGSSIMVGLNIYNGVEEDKSIEQQKLALSDTDKIYKDRAVQLKNALSDYRKSITGDDNSLVSIDEENVSSLVLKVLKKNIDDTIITLSKDALNKRTLKQEKTSLLRDASNKLGISNEKSIDSNLSSISSFLTEQYSVSGRYIPYEKKIHNLNKANWQYVGMWAEIPQKDMDLALQGGINTVLISPFRHFSGNYAWLRDVYLPVLDEILDNLYANNDVLYKTLKESIEYQLTNPEFQENLRNHYNITINKKYAWVKFGAELLENLDLSKEESAEASIWAERVLIPFIAPFLESNMASEIFSELHVESKVATIVNKLIDLKVDIHNKDAVYAIIKADEESEELPSSLKNAIDISYQNALRDANYLNINKNEIKKFDLSEDAVRKIILRLESDINQGKFNKEVDNALNNYAMSLIIVPNGVSNRSALVEKMFAAAEKISALQAAYNGHVTLAIINAKDKIQVANNDQEIVDILKDLGKHLINNYSSFYNGNIPLKMPNTKENVDFISFGALPFAINDLRYILEIISSEIDIRQRAIDDVKPLVPIVQTVDQCTFFSMSRDEGNTKGIIENIVLDYSYYINNPFKNGLCYKYDNEKHINGFGFVNNGNLPNGIRGISFTSNNIKYYIKMGPWGGNLNYYEWQ